MDGFAIKYLRLLFCFFFLFVLGESRAEHRNSFSYNSEVDDLMSDKNDSLRSLKSISEFINKSFKKEEDRCRAIFFWISENISYAPELLYTFQTQSSKASDVKDIMENKSGICTGYAALTDTLCSLCNIRSFIVSGSTKQSFLPSVIGHVWNAVYINGEWKIVDATWGSGYIKGEKFVRSRNENYFFSDPDKLSETHLPFDPIWQLLKRPINLHQFFTNAESTQTQDWNFTDSITNWLNSSSVDQLAASIRRLTQFGTKSEITHHHLNVLKYKQSEFYVAKVNHAGKTYNEASNKFNEYIQYKNKQFTAIKSDAELSKLLPAISALVDQSREELKSVPAEFLNTNESYVSNLKKYYSELEERLSAEKAFVKKYLGTPKALRKQLFYVRIR